MHLRSPPLSSLFLPLNVHFTLPSPCSTWPQKNLSRPPEGIECPQDSSNTRQGFQHVSAQLCTDMNTLVPQDAMAHSRHTLLTRTRLPALQENGSAHPFLLCWESVPITGSVLDIYIVCHSVSNWGRRATKLAVAGPAGGTRAHTPGHYPLWFLVLLPGTFLFLCIWAKALYLAVHVIFPPCCDQYHMARSILLVCASGHCKWVLSMPSLFHLQCLGQSWA